MLLLKGLLIVLGAGLGLMALGILLVGLRRPVGERTVAWRRVASWATGGLVIVLVGLGLVVVPPGRAGLRVSQISGIRPGPLGPGVHFVLPLVEDVAVYDVREHVLTTVTLGDPKAKGEPLRAQTKEGLEVGLAVSVRYRLDVRRLDHVHANLPAVAEVVPPVVAAVFRQLVPNYVVREVFATRREELRASAEKIIVEKLGADAILVREVMLSDVALPPEYAKGLEGLLLKEQQNDRMVYDIQIKEKEVRSAELEAEAEKARHVKQAEAQAAVRVLQAKAEADAMQHTLPLKEKQIEQSRLEAEARKEATLKNAEAAAQAKVIDSKAEVERSNLMAGAEAHRIRVTSLAENERLKLESDVLRENPLLIQKIVAERLSDKMQIMMVPMDGRNFFANEVFRAAMPSVEPAAPAPPAPKAVARR
jgi:regulator of protease activity HflC (stomatin/prohibitin superfamily)